MTDFVANEPGRFVSDMDSLGELPSVNAAGLGMQKNRLKPTMNRRAASLHNGTGNQGRLRMAGTAFVEWNTPSGNEIKMRMAATRAAKAVGPLELEQDGETICFVLKNGTKLLKLICRRFKTHTKLPPSMDRSHVPFTSFYQTYVLI